MLFRSDLPLAPKEPEFDSTPKQEEPSGSPTEETFPNINEFPDPSPSAPALRVLRIILGCEHTQPGVRSELQGFLVFLDDLPFPESVGLGATGPGLIQNRVTFVVGADGVGRFVFPINQFGNYMVNSVDINGDGANDIGTLVSPQNFPAQYNVGSICTPPAAPK